MGKVKKTKTLRKPVDHVRTYRLKDSQVAFLRSVVTRMRVQGTMAEIEPIRLMQVKLLEALPSPPQAAQAEKKGGS